MQPPEPLFIDVAGSAPGRRFALYHAPAGAARGLVVHAHAFAEEMNKSRRMVALQSRSLAGAGYAVLQPDLLGCGDSPGDFGDATWQRWCDDVLAGVRWLQARHGAGPLWLWGLRVGCLLAAEAAARVEVPCSLLFWQPVVAGRTALRQFLRLRTAGALIDGRADKGAARLGDEIGRGRAIEVAGYALHPALYRGLDQATLQAPLLCGRSVWIEVSAHSTAPAPSVVNAAARWAEAGWSVQTQVVSGPGFWQTTEIEDAPALVAATTAALRDSAAGDAPATTHRAGA